MPTTEGGAPREQRSPTEAATSCNGGHGRLDRAHHSDPCTTVCCPTKRKLDGEAVGVLDQDQLGDASSARMETCAAEKKGDSRPANGRRSRLRSRQRPAAAASSELANSTMPWRPSGAVLVVHANNKPYGRGAGGTKQSNREFDFSCEDYLSMRDSGRPYIGNPSKNRLLPLPRPTYAEFILRAKRARMLDQLYFLYCPAEAPSPPRVDYASYERVVWCGVSFRRFSRRWSPQRSHFFSAEFQARALAVLCCAHRLRTSPPPSVSDEGLARTPDGQATAAAAAAVAAAAAATTTDTTADTAAERTVATTAATTVATVASPCASTTIADLPADLLYSIIAQSACRGDSTKEEYDDMQTVCSGARHLFLPAPGSSGLRDTLFDAVFGL